MATRKPIKSKFTREQALARVAKIKAEHRIELEAARKGVTEATRAELQAEKARLAALAAAEKKADAHRKIIFGVVAIHGMAVDSEFKRVMQKYAKEHLTVPEDLALFDLL